MDFSEDPRTADEACTVKICLVNPPSPPEFRVSRGAAAPSEVVVAATLDGAPLEPAFGRLVVPIVRDGGRHVVHAELGVRS